MNYLFSKSGYTQAWLFQILQMYTWYGLLHSPYSSILEYTPVSLVDFLPWRQSLQPFQPTVATVQTNAVQIAAVEWQTRQLVGTICWPFCPLPVNPPQIRSVSGLYLTAPHPQPVLSTSAQTWRAEGAAPSSSEQVRADDPADRAIICRGWPGRVGQSACGRNSTTVYLIL